MITFQSLACTEGYNRTSGPIWNYDTEILAPTKGPDTFTVGKGGHTPPPPFLDQPALF